MKNYLLLALAAVALCFTACKKDNPEPTPVAVTGISLDKTMLALEIDESATVKAIIAPENATNKAVEWSVADTAVATVANGVVTGVATGETTLTAKTIDGNFTATIPVKVVTEKIPVTRVTMTGTYYLTIGKTETFAVGFEPMNATDQTGEMVCEDPEMVDIEVKEVFEGLILYNVTPKQAGTTKVIFTANDGGHTVSYGISIKADPTIVASIAISPATTTIEKGATQQLTATVEPSTAANKEVEWSSSNTAVATVDANGLVTGVAEGEATITARAKDGSGVTGTATVEVVRPTPTSVTFDGKTEVEIYTWWGKEVDLKANVTPEGASLKTLTWAWNDPNSSSNPDGLKYNVTDDKATLTYTWPSQTSYVKSVDVRALYGDGSTVLATANVYFQTFSWLLKYSGEAIDYTGLAPLTDDLNFKYNWNSTTSNNLAFIAYYRSEANVNAQPSYYKEYYIPTSEYTLTSSDESKVKVTKNDDGISWMVERLNTTDLAAVTLTYKCGEHTQTYTINLIP